MKILVAVPMDPSGVNLLKEIEDAEVDLRVDISRHHLSEIIGDYRVLIAGTSTPVAREVVERAARLRLIGLLGMGPPVLDLAAATRKGILVLGAPESVAVSVAEHALSLILSLARKIPEADASIKQGLWVGKDLMGMEIRNKVLGIVGFGAVGSLVAERARAMKMSVIVHDPHLSSEAVHRKGCTKVTLEELFSQSDVITIHAPLNRETRGGIGEGSIASMKRGVLVVNCSASQIIDEDALYSAIISGKVAGAAMDIHEEEPVEDHSLYLSEKVICTPNLSIYTREAMVESSMEIAREVVNYLQKGAIAHAVNLPEGAESAWESERPWLDLGDAMGRFVAQLHPFGLRGVRIDVAGEEGAPAMEVFTRSVLKGILGQSLGETVNLVNAKSLAEERGLRVTEGRNTVSSTYLTHAVVTLDTEQGTGIVSGTLFDGLYPRIVQVDGFGLEIVPEGNFLVIFNRDRPGVIADVGEVMGRRGINIGQMYNGRDVRGGTAITLLRIDSLVSDAVLQEIHALPNVLNATRVNMA